MAIMFDFEVGTAEQMLMDDCFTKLCTVPFSIEAARAPVVMHYEDVFPSPTLLFLCNAHIHMRRVTPPAPLRINGVATKKYAVIPCMGFEEADIENTVATLNQAGYYAYTSEVNGNLKLYVSWDEDCLANQVPAADDAAPVFGDLGGDGYTGM